MNNKNQFGLTDEEEKNLQDEFFRVSKIEEYEALDFIKKRLVPLSVEKFNETFCFYSTIEIEPINVSEVYRNLKKVKHLSFPGERKKDLIRYTARLDRIPGPTMQTFSFSIYKDEDGELTAQYLHPTRNSAFKSNVRNPGYINESYIDPSSNTEKLKFYVTKMEEQFALTWITRKFLPAYIKHFNSVYEIMLSKAINKNTGVKYHKDRDASAFSKPIEDGELVIRNLQKISQKTEPSINSRSAVYFTKSSNGAEFLFRIEKSYPDVVRVSFLDPWKNGYMGYELKPDGYPNNSFSFGKLEENIQSQPPGYLTKEEEMRGLRYISQYLLEIIMIDYSSNPNNKRIHRGKEEKEIRHSLKKVEIEEFNLFNIKSLKNEPANRVIYRADWGCKHFYFVIQKINELVYSGFIDGDGDIHLYDIRFDDGDLNTPKPAKVDQHYRQNKGLKILKSDLNESVEPSNKLIVTREDEYKALQFIKKKYAIRFGNDIGKRLRKVSISATEHPNEMSDSIFYEIKTSYDRTYFRLVRTIVGLWVSLIEEGDTISSEIYNIENPNGNLIYENAPTGDWESWEMITKPERDRLKILLQRYQEYLKSIYHPNMLAQNLYIIQKCMDNLDSTDPRLSAKPLAQLPMEMRLSMSDWVDYKDTTGQASKVMDFLINLSGRWIKPPTPPKPDIELKGIADVVWPHGRSLGNVYINGIEDMRPKINFGYGPYPLDDKFIEDFSKPGAELYLDMGQGIKIVNISQVMSRVKDALEKHKKSLMESKLSDTPGYHEALQKTIRHMSKIDETWITQYLRNMVIDGERLGKTLKKIHHRIATQPHDSDIIVFSANVKGKEKIYRVMKISNFEFGIRDASIDGDCNQWRVPVKEVMTTDDYVPCVLSKEDESRAVRYISNLVYYGDHRVGKTLKKTKVEKTNNTNSSDRVIYTAHIIGKEIPFLIFRSKRRGLVIIDQTNYQQYNIDDEDKGLI